MNEMEIKVRKTDTEFVRGRYVGKEGKNDKDG